MGKTNFFYLSGADIYEYGKYMKIYNAMIGVIVTPI